MIPDIEIELHAYLGDPHPASIAAEVGQTAVALIFLAGARAQAGIDNAILEEQLGEIAARAERLRAEKLRMERGSA
jgi:hypothetical protein